MRPMGIHPPRIGVWAFTAVAAMVSLAACGTGTGSSAPSTATTVAPVSTPSTRPAPTTTVYTPAEHESSADAAAAEMMDAWAAGSRARAAAVAMPAAVAALFAHHYPGHDYTVDRGCGQQPIVCTFGPYGGGPQNAALYQLQMAKDAKGGWYVSSVSVLT